MTDKIKGIIVCVAFMIAVCIVGYNENFETTKCKVVDIQNWEIGVETPNHEVYYFCESYPSYKLGDTVKVKFDINDPSDPTDDEIVKVRLLK